MNKKSNEIGIKDIPTYINIFAKLISDLRVKSDIYNELFEKKENFEIYNKIAPTVFYNFANSLAESIMLSIFRLLDPHGNKKNFSIPLIKKFENLPDDIQSKVTEIIKLVGEKKGIVFRHKILCHNDYKHYNGLLADYCISFPKKDADRFVNALFSLLKMLKLHYNKVELADKIITRGTGKFLLEILKKETMKKQENYKNGRYSNASYNFWNKGIKFKNQSFITK